jgi:uncharacterized protein (DUF488 family)
VKDRHKVFFTVGYQGHNIPSILRVLKENDVGLIIDVRQNPVSRKAGFSGSRLQTELERRGIKYAHFPCLGTPSHIRLQYQKNGNALAALKAYATYLRSKIRCLESLIDFASSERFCLLCLESDHNLCHRGVIADKLAEMTQCRPVHLT